MAIDESFKKPGAVPFKWEIEPGVPRQHSSLKPSPKLTPPPVHTGKYSYAPPNEVGFLSSTARSRSVSSRLRSERFRFERPNSVEVISGSSGCFPPLLKKKDDKKKKKKRNAKTEELSVDSEMDDYVSDLETLARRSISTKRMVSPFRDSVYSSSSSSLYGSPSSFSSVQSSPRAAGDAEWAAFGLF